MRRNSVYEFYTKVNRDVAPCTRLSCILVHRLEDAVDQAPSHKPYRRSPYLTQYVHASNLLPRCVIQKHSDMHGTSERTLLKMSCYSSITMCQYWDNWLIY